MMRKGFTMLLLLGMLLTVVPPTAAQPPEPGSGEGGVRPDRSDPASIMAYRQSLKDAPEAGDAVTTAGRPTLATAQGDTLVDVIVELEDAPLAVRMTQRSGVLSAASQQSYVARLQTVQAQIESRMSALDVRILDRYQRVYNGFLVRVPADEVATLAALPGVKAIHDAPVVYPALEKSVPLIGADVVSNVLGYDGTGVTVGIIDSGIDYLHAAFGGSGSVVDFQNNDPTIATDYPVVTGIVAGGWDLAGADYDDTGLPDPDPDPIDLTGHGTHVASIVAGVAPGVELYAIKIFGDDIGLETSSSLVVSGIEWAMDPNGDGDLSDHLDVINLSVGLDFGAGALATPDAVAIEAAVGAGIVAVVAAGNAGDTIFITSAPSTADRAISVAASTTGYTVDENLDYQPSTTPADTITDFSSRGPRMLDAKLKPEITAPGSLILAAEAGSGSGKIAFGGTSMASPHVAGVAALMVEAHPDWSPLSIKAAMMNTAVDLADGSWVSRYGAGRIDAVKAVEAETLAAGDDDLVSLSWGYTPFIEAQAAFTKTVELYNEGAEKTFDIAWQFSTTQTLQSGISFQMPATVTVAGDGVASVDVTLWLEAQTIATQSQMQMMLLGRANILEEYHGFITFTNQDDPSEVLRVPFYVVPRPYTDVRGMATLASPRSLTSTVQLTHTGAITSMLETFTAYGEDPRDAMLPEVDLRLLGMRHYQNMGTTFLAPVMTTWYAGPLPGLAPYLGLGVEFDLFLDVDEDGLYDYNIWTASAAQYNGSDIPDDYWLLVGLDLNTGADFVAGAVRTDYFSNYQEWHLNAAALGLDPAANDDFYFAASTWLWTGADYVPLDTTYTYYYDMSQPHVDYRYAVGQLGPAMPYDLLEFNVLRPGSTGLIVLDIQGMPGAEAMYIPTDYKSFLPMILRD